MALNTIEAAALQAIREYYNECRSTMPYVNGERPPCSHSACRKARTFAGLIGVDLDKEDEA